MCVGRGGEGGFNICLEPSFSTSRWGGVGGERASASALSPLLSPSVKAAGQSQ